ncbi:MAG TPA: 2-isopropylmalate synthase [Spongiibacteraceae bacterium]|jgi:2-isopropylmalate synthase|nr:2-isopropylmalate synthase [Spongiibacteraceae bacterium]HUH38586.1 2-isopropylmalate synthase [Spongiibacteraceae bacterium]
MTGFDHRKYRPCKPVAKRDRRWPDRVITQAPTWCSVDLRDGNQALVEPMSPRQKLAMFQLLVDVGFKEIEVGFPAASQPDFDFVRQLIEQDRVPADVTLQVLTQAREPLIARSFEALKGARRAIMHVYNSTSTVQREQVFRLDRAAIRGIAEQGARWVRHYARQQPDTEWVFQYSPESFTGTELDFAVEVCDAVTAIWEPTPAQPVIINLPATVEMATPNVYADQIEWMCDHIARRDSVIISLHTHNDRGCGVAAAELGIMAGADRIEGTLLGNGERTGNMDIVTMAMNLYSQGIDPELDLANMDRIIQVVESCTQLPVHPRHPYAGELVFTAFSGSHQDAINKCLARRQPGDPWQVAYLPIDPRDIGRTYQEVIRINSQSGKGGVAYVLARDYGIEMPRWLQIDFSPHVQRQAENTEKEVPSAAIRELLYATYIDVAGAPGLDTYQLARQGNEDQLTATLRVDGVPVVISGRAQGVLSAFVAGLDSHYGTEIVLVDYSEHTLGDNQSSDALAYVQLSVNGERVCGAAQSADIVSASMGAVVNALARAGVFAAKQLQPAMGA